MTAFIFLLNILTSIAYESAQILHRQPRAISETLAPKTLLARPLRSKSFQRKHRKVLATAPWSVLNVSDHDTHSLLGLKVYGWTESERLRERMRNSEHRVDGA